MRVTKQEAKAATVTALAFLLWIAFFVVADILVGGS